MDKKISLTGIKPTVTPHFGNFFGAIKPALELSDRYQARYFIADYHALNTVKNAQEMADHTYEVAATWLACGLDPAKVLLYRQSEIPETFELATFLMAFTAKGMMNKAHAYKAKVQDNQEKILSFTCTTVREGVETVVLFDKAYETRRIIENCQNKNEHFQNTYWIETNGKMRKSIQWQGQNIDLILIEYLI